MKHQRVRVHLVTLFSCLGFDCFSLLVYFFASVFALSVLSPQTRLQVVGRRFASTDSHSLLPTHCSALSTPTCFFSCFLWSNRMSKNLLISWPSCCSSLSFALKQRRCSYGFCDVLKHRSSLFLFACFLSSLPCWVDLIAFCGPEVSTFNPRCFRPENAYIRVNFAMWA